MNGAIVLAGAVCAAWGAYASTRIALDAPEIRQRVAWGTIVAILAAMTVRQAVQFVTPWPAAAFLPLSTNVFTLIIMLAALLFVLQIDPVIRRAWGEATELEAARARFSRALDGARDAIAIAGEDGRYVFVNDAGCALFRYPRDQILGRHYREFFAEPPTPSGATGRARHALGTGSASVVRHIRRGDGEVLLVEVDLISLGGGTLLFIGHDITERVRTVEALERERAHLDIEQEISQVGRSEIIVATGERRWSAGMYRLYGLEPADGPAPIETARQLVHPDDRAAVARSTEQVLHGEEQAPVSFRVAQPSGQFRHLLRYSNIERDTEGTAVRVTRVAIDITALRAAQSDLERERNRLALAQEITHVGSEEIDLITGEVWWSAETYRLFGFEPTDKPPPREASRERIHPDDRAITAHSTELLLRGEAHEPITHRMVMPSGQIRHILMHTRVDRDEHGIPVRATRVALDITDVQALHERLARARRLAAVGTLAAGVAHDFNNILTVIGGNIELAAMGDTARLEVAADGVRRASGIVRQMMQIARAPADTETGAARQPLVDLRTLVQDANTAVRGVLDPSIRLVTTAPAEPVLVHGDPTDLDRVLTNLLMNARDAVAERVQASGGVAADAAYEPSIRLTLRVLPEDGMSTAHAQIEVADNGPGIAPEVRERLFEPFFTTKRPARGAGMGGTGLGLASAYGIIRNLGGAIEVESEPGRGATFRVRLPLATSLDAGREPDGDHGSAPATAAAIAGATVLLVDDDTGLLDFAATALRRVGIAIECITTGAAAIEALRARRYHLAVVDVRLRGETSGWDVLREVRAEHPEQRVLIWSGTASADEALRRGATGILHKPFDAGALERAVRSAMRAAEQPPSGR